MEKYITVEFCYLTGLKTDLFEKADLCGSWDDGIFSDKWHCQPMETFTAKDGCTAFRAKVSLDYSQLNRRFCWGVYLYKNSGEKVWGIVNEVNYSDRQDCLRYFILQKDNACQEYYLNEGKRLGSQKYSIEGKNYIHFAVWAPHARKVDVVFGEKNGYIANDGFGIDKEYSVLEMVRDLDGVWSVTCENFEKYLHTFYMFRITRKDGSIAYRTDLYSRSQAGRGKFNPRGAHYHGKVQDLDGSVSCSKVIDVEEQKFWQDEFTSVPVPKTLEELVIYELHIGALGYGSEQPGNFTHALELLDYLVDLGINAIELLPMSEFEGWAHWGYGTSHYFAIESSAGGRDQFRQFVKACHQKGIAVIMDVVYNHYIHDGERCQWQYDAPEPEYNIYYWYEGQANQYEYPESGYIDNGSSGYAPCYYEEMVRKMFTGSALTLIEQFHVDGFRVDLTDAIHRNNRLNDGKNHMVESANQFGAKFLREWTRSIKLAFPETMLIAEDHSGWPLVTIPVEKGGLGFDASWYSAFYHNLIGDSVDAPFARLLKESGYGDDRPLAMDHMAQVLAESSTKIVYHESHDEAGNALRSQRIIQVAVNSTALVGQTRRTAEDRCRFVAGLTILAPATPLFFMGEEIGAAKSYRYHDFVKNKEDLMGERLDNGRYLFRFYRDIISLRTRYKCLQTGTIKILYTNNQQRILIFLRRDRDQEFLVATSLSNHPFPHGYFFPIDFEESSWKEIFNSDSSFYNGDNVGNLGKTIIFSNNTGNLVLPANGFIILQKQ